MSNELKFHKNGPEYLRIREAYLEMAKQAKYRPEAPGDGVGGIDLNEEEFRDWGRLEKEACAYAARFLTEEDSCVFRIGVSNYATNRGLVYTIEAARLLCAGYCGESYALKLLEMAMEDIRASLMSRRHGQSDS